MSNSKEFYREAQTLLKSAINKAEEQKVNFDKKKFEEALRLFEANQGTIEVEGWVDSSCYAVGQALGMAASIVATPAGWILPDAFKAGFHNGYGKTEAVYEDAWAWAQSKCSKAKDAVKSAVSKDATLNTRPKEEKPFEKVDEASVTPAPAGC